MLLDSFEPNSSARALFETDSTCIDVGILSGLFKSELRSCRTICAVANNNSSKKTREMPQGTTMKWRMKEGGTSDKPFLAGQA
jgi:hypothetical protein